MTTERDHARARSANDEHDHDEQRRGGKHRRSSSMEAPSQAVTSGLIARKADGNGVHEDADAAIATAAGSSGASLPGTIMRKFESSLGADLSNVRVHTGAESQRAASSVGAKAYTVGQDIHFGGGHYDPSSGAGEELLAHEVAHTVQQRGGTPKRQNKLAVSTPFDAAEHEADSAASAMVAGRSFTVGGGGGSRVQRKEEGAGGEAAAGEHGSGIAPAYEFTIPFNEDPKEHPLGKWVKYKFSGSLTGALKEKEEKGAENKNGAEIGASNDSKGNLGATEEIKLAQTHLGDLGSWEFAITPELDIEVGTGKIGASIKGLTVHNRTESWVKFSVAAALELFEIDVAKYKKEGLESVELPSVPVTGTVTGTKTFAGDAELSIAGSFTVTFEPNWEEVAKEVATKAAKSVAKTGAEDAAAGMAEDGAADLVVGGGTDAGAAGAGAVGAAAGPAALVTGAGLAGAAVGYGMAKVADSDATKTGAWGQDAGGKNQSAMDWGAGWGTWVDSHIGDDNAAHPSIFGGAAAAAGGIVGGVMGTAQAINGAEVKAVDAGWDELKDLL